MKRRIALLLAVFMLVAAMVPMQVFAEQDKGLEDAIKLVKSKFTIPDGYSVFNYDVSSYNDKKTWNLNWRSKDGAEGSINVSVDDRGNILNYSNYKPFNGSEGKKLPKYSKQQAKAVAEEFLNQVAPGVLPELRYEESFVNSLRQYEYNFSYTRLVNGVPFYSNGISVSVDCQTGEVRNYHRNWNFDLSFPAKEGVISMEKAQQAFKDKLGLELQYQYTYEDEQIKIFPAYVQKYRYNIFIDALTGEKTELSRNYGVFYDTVATSMANEKAKLDMAAGNTVNTVVLTEEELKAVEKVSKLISKETAEKTARNIKSLELTEDFALKNSNLTRNWPDRDEFVWRLEFRKEGSDKTANRYVSVAVNALNGEVKSFYTNYSHKEEETAQYDKNTAKAAAEALLKELQPAKFAETYYDESGDDAVRPYETQGNPVYYNFSYIRKVNGVPFPGNTLRVGYDAINGKIISYEAGWFAAEFPSVENAVSLEAVYQKMFSNIGLELQYVSEPKKMDKAEKIVLPESGELNVKLVYGVKAGKPVFFNANTGDIINSDGKPYKETKPVEYTDVAGHFAESQIKVLAEYGITLGDSEFKPDQAILQKEFFTLLSKTLGNYYPYPVVRDAKELDNLYANLMREGIVKAGEKAPDSVVTREDAVKFIIRAMKYDKVADIKGIYNCDFKDLSEINPELVGYVVIAKGLEIIGGYDGLFQPKNEMSRAQAAVAIYNYLQK